MHPHPHLRTAALPRLAARGRSVTLAALTALAPAAAGCGLRAAAPLPPCPAPAYAARDWQRVELNGLSVAIPPAAARRAPGALGEADEGDAWELPHGGVLGVQRPAEDPPFGAQVTRAPVRECSEEIGGARARIVVFQERSRIVYALHWPHDPDLPVLYALAWHPEDQRLALAAFRSVRLEPPR
jgi:hypothetical protein